MAQGFRGRNEGVGGGFHLVNSCPLAPSVSILCVHSIHFFTPLGRTTNEPFFLKPSRSLSLSLLFYSLSTYLLARELRMACDQGHTGILCERGWG